MNERLNALIHGDTFNRAFQRKAEFQSSRPQMQHSSFWWAEKVEEEVDEMWRETSNEPTPEEKAKMLAESADVFLSLVGYWQSFGVSPEVARLAVLNKLDEIEQRYPVDLFDGSNGLTFNQNYAIARGRSPYLPDGAGTEIELWNSD